jgi:F420H(2)-dependent quinone reductase
MPLTGEYEPSPSAHARNQVELYERTDGREGKTPLDLPIIVLTTVGAKSGKLRKTPLMRVEHDGEYVVVASKGGAPEHPTWYYNIVDAPLVELQDGPVRKDYTPRELTGDERAVWWDRAVEAWPAYADYQTKTDRLIPLFLLTPTE